MTWIYSLIEKTVDIGETVDRMILVYTLVTVVTSNVAKTNILKYMVVFRRIRIFKVRVHNRAHYAGCYRKI